jgi:hypothetical protein
MMRSSCGDARAAVGRGRPGLPEAIVLCLVASALACASPPRIDTSSEESAAASLKRVRASLPQKVRAAFDSAVATVALSHLDEEAVKEVEGRPETFGAEVLRPLNGMTGEEVLTEAQRILAEREAGRPEPPPASTTPPL